MTTTTGSGQTKLRKHELFRMLHYEPHPGQLEIHKSTAPRRIIASGVRWGKTRCAAMEGVAAAMQPAERSIGWCVGPTYDLADRVFREIQVVVLERLRHRIIGIRESERRIFLRNLGNGVSEIRAKSADNPVSLLGEGLDWVIVDEASRMRPTIWQSHLSQRLIDKQGWALLISTPKGKGYFYDLFLRGKHGEPGYASWNMPSWTNPLLDKGIIEQERARLPERVFRQEYEAAFVEGSGSVFSNVRECATGVWQPPREDMSYRVGLDLAKTEDFTVVTIMDRERNVVYVDRFQRLDWSTQLARIQGNVRRFGNPTIFCDVTGVGDPIYEALRKEGMHAKAYSFTTKSKTALVNALVMTMEQRKIVLPKPELWPEGIEELENFEYSVTEQGHVKMSAPGGQHDDCVMSLALALWDWRPSHPYCSIRVESF